MLFRSKTFNYYIAISDSFKDMLKDRGFKEDRIFVAYNGIDFDDLPSVINKEDFLSSYNIDHNGRDIVGIVARLDLVKDHETFIKAADKVIKSNKDIIFLIAGEGNDEKRLKTMVSSLGLNNNVLFLGYVNDTDSFFNAIDINVLTSISESFPYVILEGARMKKTMVTTNVGGIKNLIKDGENGYLINVGDWEGLAERIIDLSKDKNKLITLGEKLYDDVNKNYSSKAMGIRHSEIYNEILKKWR